jgi:hypothetical protein
MAARQQSTRTTQWGPVISGAGQRYAPRHVAIPSNKHHEGARPYLCLVTIRGTSPS